MTLQKLFLTFFGAGLSPKYPMITALAAAFVSGIAILYTMGMETLFMIILAVSIIGIFEINKYLNSTAQDKKGGQPNIIVIDKAAGMWLSLLIPYTTALTLSFPYAQEFALLFSFASFCLFDIWKPSTIGWISRNVNGGLGMIGSSLLAGFAGGFLTIVILLGADKILGNL